MPALTTTAALGLTAATTTASFVQASKQKKLQKEAEVEAEKAMQEARKKLEVNFYKGLGIQKEPYELEREALLSAGAQSIAAGVESARGAASVAGQIQMAQNVGQRKIATSMGQELTNLDKLVASEESRLRDLGANLDLQTVEGAQLAARNREAMANQAFMKGMQGVTSLGGQIAKIPSLYPETPAGAETAVGVPETAQQAYKTGSVKTGTETIIDPRITQAYNSAIQAGTLDPSYLINGQSMPLEQALQVMQANSGLTPLEFQQYLEEQNQDFSTPMLYKK